VNQTEALTRVQAAATDKVVLDPGNDASRLRSKARPAGKVMQDPAAPLRPPHLPALTGLRALTIVWVVLGHMSRVNQTLFSALVPLLTVSGHVSVRMDALFILSGFMMAHVYVRCNERLSWSVYGRFLWRRWMAIYPGHLATLLPLVAVAVLSPRLGLHVDAKDFANYGALPFQLTLTQSWPGMLSLSMTWNYPAWFLSALWLGFLAVFPCAWLLTPRLRRTGWVPVWIFAPLAVWLLLQPFPPIIQWRYFIRVACGLLCGTALHAAWARRHWVVAGAQRHLNKLVLICLGLFVLAYWQAGWANLGLLALLPLLIAGASGEKTLAAKVLASRPLVRLGELSYALFISHALAVKFMKLVLPAQQYSGSPFVVRVAVFVAYGLVILGCAWVLHKWVEVPCKQAFKPARPTVARIRP
jgi:peptidoglycan/LPS O-acetylase OafA/YrhL